MHQSWKSKTSQLTSLSTTANWISTTKPDWMTEPTHNEWKEPTTTPSWTTITKKHEWGHVKSKPGRNIKSNKGGTH